MKLLEKIFIGFCIVFSMLSGFASHHAGNGYAAMCWLLVIIVLLMIIFINKINKLDKTKSK
jgi:hypothetical protein